ncbi:MAG: carbon monoxide dehydrogenase subunit G, partial [Polaromonas sp.]|nr:carbon monoxide dehydrogenase subunit G [Polaromonas sp.]
MDMQGSRQLAVTQQQAWDALNDPAVLKACIPGCDKVEATGENQYAIAMALKIGPVSAKFTGKISLSEMNPPASYKLSFDGQGGVAGFGKGSA